MPTRVVRVSVGAPFATGEECPECLFDSVAAVLLTIDSRPSFIWLCGRCQSRLGEVES